MGWRARVAAALGAAAVLVAAVLTLRSSTVDDLDALLADPPVTAPVVVEEFATGIVTLPDPGPPPDPPGGLRVRAEQDRLQVSWGPGLPGGRTAEGAAGYQVRWGEQGGPDMRRVVAGPGAELTGLRPGSAYRVQVRSVDAVGRRSLPVFGFGTLVRQPDTGWQQHYGYVDDFDDPGGVPAPDSTHWRFASAGKFCLRAGSGSGAEAGRLVLQLDCGSTLHTLLPA
ncbi:MAG: fibronectin type III domain-containing protein, partial [Pseudonocardiaceae bacterium]